MAEAKGPKDDRAQSAKDADVRAVSAAEVRVDASDKLSYKEYAALFKKPVVTVQRIIERKAEPPPKKREVWPNMEVRTVVKWGELPKEEPAKLDRIAVTVHTHILHIPTPPKPPPKGIGSMEP